MTHRKQQKRQLKRVNTVLNFVRFMRDEKLSNLWGILVAFALLLFILSFYISLMPQMILMYVLFDGPRKYCTYRWAHLPIFSLSNTLWYCA